MTINKHQLYGLAAVLAAVAAILQLMEREWFRGATSAILAAAMALAATGFPEKSVAQICPLDRTLKFGKGTSLLMGSPEPTLIQRPW